MKSKTRMLNVETLKEPVSSHIHQELEGKLPPENKCYVLITCDQAEVDGRLDVEMSYGGDDLALVSHLLSDAQAYLDDADETLE